MKTIEQVLNKLKELQLDCISQDFLDESSQDFLYKKGKVFGKIIVLGEIEKFILE